jgi:uncharacterized protein
VPLDRLGIEILDRDRCMSLLRSAPIGRLGFTSGALPVILPISFVVVDEDIVFRTAPGSKLEASLRRQVACIEADGFDPLYHTGWSVLVTGPTRVVTDPEEAARMAELPLPTWTRVVEDEHHVVLRSELVTGRWLRSSSGEVRPQPQHAWQAG